MQNTKETQSKGLHKTNIYKCLILFYAMIIIEI